LKENQEFKISAAPQTANPRFLQTLLDDICVFGDHDELDKRIDLLLKAKNTGPSELQF
jgi:hypothetical protein